MTPREVLALCREKDVRAVDLRFSDLWGVWRHSTIPVGKLDEEVFEEGIGVELANGNSSVHARDLLAVPQPDTAFLDPFAAIPTLILICNIHDPATREPYSRDPRNVATKAMNCLRHTGIADVAHFGPQAQFFIFDSVRFESSSQAAFYQLDTAGERASRGFSDLQQGAGQEQWRLQAPVFCPSADQLADLRSAMMQAMLDCGLEARAHHEEAGACGQCAIELAPQPLLRTADWMQIYKYCVRNVARRHNKTATFMAKPLVGARGSGMPVQLSLSKNDESLFAGGGYAGISEVAQHAMGGILRHAPALLAFTNPTTNSYKRLAPGCEAPINLVYSQQSRSAACRVPLSGQSPKSRGIEFRCPDAMCNPYLAFAAIMMGAVDGIQTKLSPGQPVDVELIESGPDRAAEIRRTPATLDDALTALENDNEFLLRDDVFTPEVIEAWIEYKRRHEVAALRQRPHPYEFCLYFDA